MRVFAASDLHFEFHNDIEWLPPLPEADAFDVLVLAGDIGAGAYLGSALRRLRYKYPDKPIVCIAGNHEHYGKNINRDIMARIDVPDVYFLENGRVDLLGFHFLGATLWTGFDALGEDTTKEAMKLSWKHIADFISIRTEELSESGGVPRFITTKYMAELYQTSRAWLIEELQKIDPKKTIVVTHFPPAREYRHRQIQEDPISGYFQANCMDIIKQYQPALWIYIVTGVRADSTLEFPVLNAREQDMIENFRNTNEYGKSIIEAAVNAAANSIIKPPVPSVLASEVLSISEPSTGKKSRG